MTSINSRIIIIIIVATAIIIKDDHLFNEDNLTYLIMFIHLFHLQTSTTSDDWSRFPEHVDSMTSLLLVLWKRSVVALEYRRASVRFDPIGCWSLSMRIAVWLTMHKMATDMLTLCMWLCRKIKNPRMANPKRKEHTNDCRSLPSSVENMWPNNDLFAKKATKTTRKWNNHLRLFDQYNKKWIFCLIAF